MILTLHPASRPDSDHSPAIRHIDEIFDATANKFVFRFISLLKTDGDPATTSTDRQRIKIKSYSPSPANRKGTVGETVNYKWRFKVPNGFEPLTNFNHLHQIKPVDGDDGDPLFTLIPRKGSNGQPNRMELIFDQSDATTTTLLVGDVPLSDFEGIWVDVTETIFVSTTSGFYSILIKRVSDNSVIMNYTNSDIQTIRPTNSFIRPKWGIYRRKSNANGILPDLRDEEVLFSDFSVSEGILKNNIFQNKVINLRSTIITSDLEFNFENEYKHHIKIYSINGDLAKTATITGI